MKLIVVWIAASILLVVAWFVIKPPPPRPITYVTVQPRNTAEPITVSDQHQSTTVTRDPNKIWRINNLGAGINGDCLVRDNAGNAWLLCHSNGWNSFYALIMIAGKSSSSNTSAYIEQVIAEFPKAREKVFERYKDAPLPQRNWDIADKSRIALMAIIHSNAAVFGVESQSERDFRTLHQSR